MIEIQIAVKNLLLPPGILLILMLIGLFTSRRMSGKILMFFSLVLLWALSLPFIGDRLLCMQETIPVLQDSAVVDFRPQAILVLGGGSYRGDTEYGGDTVGANLLVRLRYAAWLAHKYQLPVIPTGGSKKTEIAEARLARTVLENEFSVNVPFIEDQSRTTWENAHFTAKLLERENIDRVLLVTHSWHMPRALAVFNTAQIHVLPAPTLFDCPGKAKWSDWIPDADALKNSRQAMHEMLGRIWYRLKTVLPDMR